MPAAEIARQIKAQIHAETGLTASAGVSFNKFLAKTASGLRKPDGLTVIRPEQATAFLAALPIDQFHGVGPATARRMQRPGNCHRRRPSGADRAGAGGDVRSDRRALLARGARCDDGARSNQPAPPLAQHRDDLPHDLVTATELASALTPLAAELARVAWSERTIRVEP